MAKAIIFAGKIPQTGEEIYQLLIDCNYTSFSYNTSIDRDLFFEEVSNSFVERMLDEKPSSLGIFNGMMISETGEHERISRLEWKLANQLGEQVSSKLRYISERRLISPSELN